MLRKTVMYLTAVVLLAGGEKLLAKESQGQGRSSQRPRQVEKQGRGGPQFGPQQFDRWLGALITAYQEDDSEKMGQLLRKMKRARERQGAQKAEAGRRPGQLRTRRAGRGKDWEDSGAERGRARFGRSQEAREGPRRRARGFERGDKGRGGRLSGREGAGRRGQGPRHRGIRRSRGRRCEDRGGWDRSFGRAETGGPPERAGMRGGGGYRDRGWRPERRDWHRRYRDHPEASEHEDTDFEWD